MEYIEPKPVEVDLKKKKRKKIITGVTCGVLAAGLAVGAFFLISKVFIEYENINLYTFNYDDSDPKSEATITAVREDKELPKRLRLPTRYKKHPITALGSNAFLERKEIEEIILPDSLKEIGNECFLGCDNLVKINVPKSLESVGTDAFERTGWYNAFPTGDIVQFGDFLYSFKGQMSPNSAILGSHDSPKAASYSGNKVYLSDFSHYSKGVFKNQKNLVYAEFPEKMSLIPESFLEGCSALTEISLPSSLTHIDDAAFKNCSELHVEGFNDLNNLVSLGSYALANTKLSGEIVFNNIISNVGEGIFQGCTSITKVTVGDQFRNIPDYAFDGCTSLTEFKMPDREVTSDSRISYVGNSAFKKTLITNFHVPFNSTIVRASAFEECPNLTSLYAYDNATGTKTNTYKDDGWSKTNSKQGLLAIEKNCFTNSVSFQEIILVDKNNAHITSVDEVHLPRSIQYLGDINAKSNVFTNTAVKALHFNNTKISTISPSLCEGATQLATVEFGSDSSVKSIKLDAFRLCTSLDNVVIPNSVTSMSTGIFYGCTSLKNVTLSKNTAVLADETFAECTSLEQINIPSGYTTFGIRVFAGCTSLTTVRFMENYDASSKVFANIGEGAFDGCSSLDNVVLPENVKKAASSVFANTNALTTLVLNYNGNLKTVTKNMFEGSGIQAIYLPRNYNIIDDNAFKNCTALKSITLSAPSVVTLKASSFSGVTLEHIYVPSDLVTSYQNSTSWSALGATISGLDKFTVSFDKGEYGRGSYSGFSELSGYKYSLPGSKFSTTDYSKRFKAWDVNGVTKNTGDIITLSENVTLTALWEDIPEVTVTFDGNGGSGAMAPINVLEGDTLTLPSSMFVPASENLEFKAWYVDGAEYYPGDYITIEGDTVVTALYQEVEEVEPDVPEEDDDEETSETSEETKRKNTSIIAIVILSIAGAGIVGLILFAIIRFIVLKKIYG